MGSERYAMRFVGLTEIAAYLVDRPTDADAVRAWLTEIRHGTWANVDALALDFAHIDASQPPAIVFVLRGGHLWIETLINFRIGLAVLTGIRAGYFSLSLGSIS